MSEVNHQTEDQLNLQDMVTLLKRHRRLLLGWILGCIGAAVIAFAVLPRQYKSSSLLNITGLYFQVPFLNDTISGSRDAAEMAAQKQALFRLALADTFLDQLGEKYDLFKSQRDTQKRINERNALRKRIEYMTMSATTFSLSSIAHTASLAHDMTESILEQVTLTLIQERQKSLMSYQASLRKQLEALRYSTSGNVSSAVTVQPELLKQELGSLDAKITALEAQFTPNHPTVVELKKRSELLKQMLERSQNPENSNRREVMRRSVVSAGKSSGSFDLADELIRRINYIDIVLELEHDKRDVPYLEVIQKPEIPPAPIFPKLPNLLAGGLILGLLISGIFIAYAELKQSLVVTPKVAAEALDLTYLGNLPPLMAKAGALAAQQTDAEPKH